jgi:hypothetical protein
MRLKASVIITLVNNETTLKLLSPMIADSYTLNPDVKLLAIELWGSDHVVVDVFALPGCSIGWVGSLFLRFWDNVNVPSSRAQQANKNISGQETEESLQGPFRLWAKLVVVRQGEVNMSAGGH